MDLAALLRHQGGVVSRRQALGTGLDDDDIARRLRRREWARLYRGVYVDHTGAPTWHQRAWGATLLHDPAALGGRSALAAAGAVAPTGSDAICLVVAAHRRVADPPGVRTTRTRRWEHDVQLHLSPPRVRLEPAALVAASEAATDDAAVALLGDLVQQRRTTAPRLQEALAALTRLSRRRLLAEVLGDVSEGALSALERRYLRDVEAAHGLPRGQRQRRMSVDGMLQVRDVDYAAQRTLIELDGRLGHELWAQRWADLGRDLLSLAAGAVTIRIGWGQVLDPCRLAVGIGAVLRARGWLGKPRQCAPTCEVT
jgi:hypothetical protein